MARRETGAPATDLTASSSAARALEVIEGAARDMLGRPLGPDENFFDAGLTSLGLVRLHELGRPEIAGPFPVTAMFACPNLRALSRYLTRGEPPAAARPAGGGQVRRVSDARREMRKRVRDEDGWYGAGADRGDG